MMLASMRGQWATARDEASNVLAQGGMDDQARMITVVSYLALVVSMAAGGDGQYEAR